MSEYNKLRAKNIAERNAILAKIFKQENDNKKPKKRSRISKKRKLSNRVEDKNNNDNDEDDDVEETEEYEHSDDEPPKKRPYLKFKVTERKEYNLRVRPVRLASTSHSDIFHDDLTTNHKSNHQNAYKTRSWYHLRRIEDDGVTTRSHGKKNYAEEEGEMGSESIESSHEMEESSDDQQTVTSQVEITAGCATNEGKQNSSESS